MLNMEHDPSTSAEVRATMRSVAERSNEHVRRLLRETLGPAMGVPDLATTIFLTLRGIVVSQQLLDTLSYDAVAPETDRIARQRSLLSQILAPYGVGRAWSDMSSGVQDHAGAARAHERRAGAVDLVGRGPCAAGGPPRA